MLICLTEFALFSQRNFWMTQLKCSTLPKSISVGLLMGDMLLRRKDIHNNFSAG